MKIDEKDFPIIEYLRMGRLPKMFPNTMITDNNFIYNEKGDYTKDFINFTSIVDSLHLQWRKISDKVGDNIYYITNTYIDAMRRSKKAFEKIDLKEIFNGKDKYYGCITSKASEKGHTFLYGISDENHFWFFDFYNQDALVASMAVNGDMVLSYCTKGEELKCGLNDNYYLLDILSTIKLFIMMEKYAKVETKISKALSQQKDEQLGVISNSTKCDIKIRDSKWFTTICRDEGFMVRGHFRLQPKKINGEWTKELIYINEFEKHGYHRQAEILNDSK